jgi:hypothetical protein
MESSPAKHEGYLSDEGGKGKVLSAGSWEWVGVCVQTSRQFAACKINMPQENSPRNQKMYQLILLFLKIDAPFSTLPQLPLISG